MKNWRGLINALLPRVLSLWKFYLYWHLSVQFTDHGLGENALVEYKERSDPGLGEKTQSHHYVQCLSALGTVEQTILTDFAWGVFVFVSVVCDWTELCKYQTDLRSNCCGGSMHEVKRERGCLKLILFLTLLSVYWTFNISLSMSIFRGSCCLFGCSTSQSTALLSQLWCTGFVLCLFFLR